MKKMFKIAITYISVIAIAFILSLDFFRIDLTSEGRYTLSDYTKENLKSLKEPVIVKIYLDGDDIPMTLKNLRQAVKELLDEFDVYSGEGVEYYFTNPTAIEDDKAKKALYVELYEKGIEPILSKEESESGKTSQKMVFPAAIVSFKGKEAPVNLLQKNPAYPETSEQNVNNSIQALEYEFMNALNKLQRNKKPEIVFIEGHGELNEYEVMDASRILSEYYLVKRGKIGGRVGVLDNFEAVIVAKPEKEFSEEDKFVLDQYLMQGGKIMWLTEGAKVHIDSLKMRARTIAMGRETSLINMLFSYGARVNYDLVQDKQASVIGLPEDAGNGQVRVKPYQWNYFPLILSDNSHVVNKYLDLIKLEFASSIDTVGENPNIKKTILLKTSPDSKSEQVPVPISLDMVRSMPDDPTLDEGSFNIAVLLEGEFESAFKYASLEKYFPELPEDSVLRESKNTKMIVVSDGDLIRNDFDREGKPRPLGFDPYSRNTFQGNGQFILNAVNYLCNDAGLMSIRARELKLRILNKEKTRKDSLKIQLINIFLPIIIVILFGITIIQIRKRKYKKTK